ncbi:MAG: hypothetical protein WDM85_14420 [Caulobacteraceae bacterium]
MSLAIQLQPPQLAAERPQDAAAVERLVLRAFGPGRSPRPPSGCARAASRASTYRSPPGGPRVWSASCGSGR